MEIKRGDIFYIANNPYATGDKPERPAVIVSNDIGNKFSDRVEVVFLTTQEKRYQPTHASIICRVPSTALCENVSTVSKERLRGFVKSCTDSEMQAIDKCLKVSLALDQGEEITTAEEQESEIMEQIIEDDETARLLMEAEIERNTYKQLYYELLNSIISGSASR